MGRLATFHQNCLRKIFWPINISNKDLLQNTNSTNIVDQIRERRMRWLGHVLRKPASDITKVALRWTPQGKRPRGRPKTTWRRTVQSELMKMGVTWGEAERKAMDRPVWRKLAATLCSVRSKEDK